MKNLFILAISTLLGAQAVAGFKDAFEFRYMSTMAGQQASGAGEDTTSEHAFDQFVDPTNPTTTLTFKQRYWIDSRYTWSSSAPVILYLCGEWTCSANETRAIERYASKLKAHMVIMEHRYYGHSQPFDKLSAENLRFLTTANALNDFARLQVAIQAEKKWTGKWIVVGGSYSASLAAYYRMLYPNLVVGAYASSGPVRAEANFEEYDLHVATVAGPTCAAQMKRVVAKVEAVLDNPQELKKIKKLFDAEKLTDKVDFLYLIADMGALAVQYGYRDKFCSMINGGDELKGYADFTKYIYDSWGMNALSGSAAGAMNESPTDFEGAAMRQWFYQSCTEYGYWQNAYHDSAITVRSSLINPVYHQGICNRLFKILDPVPTEAMNREFYEPLLNAQTSSHVLFINGSQDPWSKLSIDESNHNNTNILHSSYLIEGAAHCDDLRPDSADDSESLKKSRNLVLQKMKEWLEI